MEENEKSITINVKSNMDEFIEQLKETKKLLEDIRDISQEVFK